MKALVESQKSPEPAAADKENESGAINIPVPGRHLVPAGPALKKLSLISQREPEYVPITRKVTKVKFGESSSSRRSVQPTPAAREKRKATPYHGKRQGESYDEEEEDHEDHYGSFFESMSTSGTPRRKSRRLSAPRS